MHERKSKTSDQITMKCLHILLTTCCLISSGLAKPTSVVAYQDSLGQYSFGYTSPNSARAEIRKLNGETQGAYSYSDDGKNAFSFSAMNLPQPSVPLNTAFLPDSMEESDEIRTAEDLTQACLIALHMRVDLLREQVPDTQEVVESRGTRPQQVAEALDDSIDVTKIGANNVFLRDLREEKKGSVESEERIPIQAKEENVEKLETKNLEEVGSHSADKVFIKAGETENSEGNLKTITEESQGTLAQNDPAGTADKPALGIALRSNEEELKEAKQIKPQESAATDKPDTSQKIIGPISVLSLDHVYPSFFEYAPLPYSIYSIA